MPVIKPFTGILYNKDRVVSIDKVLAPPYDIITPVDQERLYELSPYNIVRLDFGKDLPGDTQENNKYTRAAHQLNKWLSEEILKRDPYPSIYFYEILYTAPEGSEERIMKGFISLCKLEEFERGNILPHEYTLSRPKSDRLNLLRACRANFSLIFSLYSLPEQTITHLLEAHTHDTSPRIEVKDEKGITHRLWGISDESLISPIQDIMKDRKIFIADGHHRYEAALRYRDEQRRDTGDQDDMPYDYVMMYLVNMDEPGLTILPTHRILQDISPEMIHQLKENVEQYFHIRYIPFYHGEENALIELEKALHQAKGKSHAIGMYINGDNYYTLLSLKSEEHIKEIYPDRPRAWRNLDVSILQGLIFDRILGIKERALKDQENLAYTHDIKDALDKVKDGDFQIAFLLNPPTIKEIEDVIMTGERMPQKSTYFYPKVRTGIVIYKF